MRYPATLAVLLAATLYCAHRGWEGLMTLWVITTIAYFFCGDS